MSQEKWGNLTSIASLLINKTTLNKEFSIRYQEQIGREEIYELRRKFNIFSLSLVVTLIVIVSVLIIIQNRLEIFNESYLIPFTILPIIVILSVIGLSEFLLMKKYGFQALEKNLGSVELYEKEIQAKKTNDTKNYLIVKDAFEKVHDIDTDSKLPGLLIHILLANSKFENTNTTMTKNDIYKSLFFLSHRKEKILYNELRKINSYSIEILTKYVEEYKRLIEQFKLEKIPKFFVNKSDKLLEAVNLFDVNKIIPEHDTLKKHYEVLELILKNLSKEKLTWALTGSMNQLIQGIDILPEDIDIVSTKEDIFRIYEILEQYQIKKLEFQESKEFRSWFATLKIKGIKVELMADLEFKDKDHKWQQMAPLDNIELINYKDYKIPARPLTSELKFYESLNREKDSIKIKKIKEHINK